MTFQRFVKPFRSFWNTLCSVCDLNPTMWLRNRLNDIKMIHDFVLMLLLQSVSRIHLHLHHSSFYHLAGLDSVVYFHFWPPGGAVTRRSGEPLHSARRCRGDGLCSAASAVGAEVKGQLLFLNGRTSVIVSETTISFRL